MDALYLCESVEQATLRSEIAWYESSGRGPFVTLAENVRANAHEVIKSTWWANVERERLVEILERLEAVLDTCQEKPA